MKFLKKLLGIRDAIESAAVRIREDKRNDLGRLLTRCEAAIAPYGSLDDYLLDRFGPRIHSIPAGTVRSATEAYRTVENFIKASREPF